LQNDVSPARLLHFANSIDVERFQRRIRLIVTMLVYPVEYSHELVAETCRFDTQKAQNRRKYVPTVPLASFDRAVNQEPSQAFIRDEIMEKVGPLGVAVFDCLVTGGSPSVLVGRVELGSPTLYRVRRAVKAVRREVSHQLPRVKDEL